MKTKVRRANGLWLLLSLYGGIVLIRFMLAMLTTSYPTIKIDEFLYFNLARSIATKGELLYRGQAADYAFILYPLMLSPIYLLFGEGAHFYRLIQLWNILLMSTSIFPLFCLGKKMGLGKKTLTAAVLSMLVPDFILGEFVFSEAILFPLFFTLMVCAYSYMEDSGRRWILWSGFIGGLLYSTKPGAAAPAVVFLLFAAGAAIKRKQGKAVIRAAEGFAVFLFTAAFFLGLARFAFGYRGGFLSIYETQFNGMWEWHFGEFLKNLAVYPAYFVLSCGVLGAAYPVIFQRTWKEEKRRFFRFAAISLLAMMIGSAWALEQVEGINCVQIRYVAMYMPLMLLFCFIQDQQAEAVQGRKLKLTGKTGAAALAGYVMLCTLILGCKAGTSSTDTHCQLALSLLNDRILPLSSEWLGSIIVILLCAAAMALCLAYAGKKNFRQVCVLAMTGFMAVNGAFGYAYIHEFYSRDSEKEGLAVQRITEGKPYIYLLSGESAPDYGADVNSRGSNQTVFMNDFISCLQENGGIYKPYIPERMRGMASVSKTPDADLLVVDTDSFPFLHWRGNVNVLPVSDREKLHVVQFAPGERMVESTLSNIRNRRLDPGVPGILMLYDEAYYGKPLTVRLKVKSDTACEMTVNSTREIYAMRVTPGMMWYEVTFNHAEEAFNIISGEAPVTIVEYKLLSGDTFL